MLFFCENEYVIQVILSEFSILSIQFVSPNSLNIIKTKAATGWSVFASGVDLGRSRVLSGPPDRH